jgi:putative transposase
VAIKAFEIGYGANYPKAVAKIVDHADVLLEFHRYPGERWIHLRTTNPIECASASSRRYAAIASRPVISPWSGVTATAPMARQ